MGTGSIGILSVNVFYLRCFFYFNFYCNTPVEPNKRAKLRQPIGEDRNVSCVNIIQVPVKKRIGMCLVWYASEI